MSRELSIRPHIADEPNAALPNMGNLNQQRPHAVLSCYNALPLFEMDIDSCLE